MPVWCSGTPGITAADRTLHRQGGGGRAGQRKASFGAGKVIGCLHRSGLPARATIVTGCILALKGTGDVGNPRHSMPWRLIVLDRCQAVFGFPGLKAV